MPHRLPPCTLTCSLIDSPHDSEQRQTTLASLDPSKPSADRFGRLLRSAKARFRSHLRPNKKNDETKAAPQKKEFVNFSRPNAMASSRPPQSPVIGSGAHKLNHTSSAASFSRFVEGSMNDRVSAAPPPSYLEDMDVEEYERQFVGTPATEHAPTMERHHTRQTSTTAYEPSAPPQENEQEEQQPPAQPPMGHSRSKSKFLLTPLWDGVREKFSLSRSKSWGAMVSGKDAMGRPSLNTQADSRSSIHRGRGSIMTAPCTPSGETPPPVPPVPVFRGAAAALATRDQEAAKEAAKKFSAADYPTKEEVMESYKNLVASGFFEQHAIHGTRHPLRAAQSAGTVLSNSPIRHDSVNGRARAATTAFTSSRPSPVPSRSESPAEDLKPFAEHLAQNNDEKKLHAIFTSFHRKTASVPVNNSMAPPPLPSPSREEPTRTIGSAFVNDYLPPQTDPVTAPDSPSRGTKRGTDPHGNNIETNVDYGSIRKLAKKLRKSQSKIEFDERPSSPTKSRTSTSSFRSAAASVMSAPVAIKNKSFIFGSKDKGKARESMESRPATSAGLKGDFLSEEGTASFFSPLRQATGLDDAISVAIPVRPGQARITKVPKSPSSLSLRKGFLGFVRRRNSVSHKSQRGVEEQSTRCHRPSANEAMPVTTNTYVHANGYRREEEDSMGLGRDRDEDDAMIIDSPEPEYQLSASSNHPGTPQRPSTSTSTTTPVSIPRFHYPKPTQQPQSVSPLKTRPQPNRAPPPVPGYGLGDELVAKERKSGDSGSVSGIVSHRDSGLGGAGEDVENIHRAW
ncbi:hypothetical protein QR685DRAFT_264156 [Neurospora intermedia]|uniref:Uncharacterized protein n=1 Tax=Neurospora intermedia TaxID=5142 RepID=A0ABR3DDV2_NEUIN